MVIMSKVDLDKVSDEQYLVLRAKMLLDEDPYLAKAWMITAKSLFPDNFGIRFEAYLIEKSAKNVKEAAKCFSELFQKFQDESELWTEVQAVTTALRSDCGDQNSTFLRDMFSHISQDVQHQLLLVTADRSEDTMEHCRLLLLLLKQFPQTVGQHGPKLVDTLMTAEKHSHYQDAVNCYRKLLVCDLLPLLSSSLVELPTKQLFRMLHKSIEFYVSYLMLPNKVIEDLPEAESKIEDPWQNLFIILDMTGRKLNWELIDIFGQPCWDNMTNQSGPRGRTSNPGQSQSNQELWNKELYWQKVVQFFNSKQFVGDDLPHVKQLLYCTTCLFYFCLHQYVTSLDTAGSGDFPLVLIEAFSVPLELENVGEPSIKRRKSDFEDTNFAPLLTVSKPISGSSPQIVQNFLMAVRCWDLLHKTESLEREFFKLRQHLKLDIWLRDFMVDRALYKGLFDDVLLVRVEDVSGTAALRLNLRRASSYYCKGMFPECVDCILQIVMALPPPSSAAGKAGSLLQQPTKSGRHMHFLPLSRTHVLHYCVKLLLAALKQCLIRPNVDANLVMGHMFTLMQYDWPNEEELATTLLQRIQQKGSFSYSIFQNYIINLDLLEEFTYLTTDQAGNVTLDIIPSTLHTSQRRITTRGTDKGVKEDFKMAMRRQVSRCNENLDTLIIRFLTTEKELLLQSLQ